MTFKLTSAQILRDDAQIRLTRATLSPARPKSLHTHDFFELFWVQNGEVRHHLPQGAETLSEGDVVFLQPGDAHGLQGRGDHALIVSIAIHPDTISALSKRHPSLRGHLFWAESSPQKKHRDIRQLARLNQAAVALEESTPDTLAAEAFLLPLCAELVAEDFPPSVPHWLSQACLAAREPAVFRDGAAGLVTQTGKAHAHVSRMMRKHLGISPSDYINEQRMAYAARALTTDGDAVSIIAADCGIPNMSHFHKLFRAAFGMTPLQYRQRFQRQIVQPTDDAW